MKMNRYTIHICLLAFIILLFGSCKIGKSYVRPQIEIPDVGKQLSDSASLGDKDWYEIYTDEPLRALIGKALIRNSDMKIAVARIKEMAARKRIKVAGLLPEVDANITAEREFENDGGDNSKQSNTFGAKAALSWELDLWGNLRWGKDAAVAEYMQTIEARRALQMTLVAEVATAYYELVAFDNELNIVRQTLEARREGVRLARLRFEGGLTSETSYRQAQVELARTATLIPDLEREITLKENDIAFLVGEFPNQITRSTLLQEFLLPDVLPAGLPSALLVRRPDIRQAEQSLIAANAEVGVAYTNLFPRITLTGRYGLESSELSDLLNSPYGLLQGALLGPIFSSGKNMALLKAQKAVFEQEGYQYEKSVLNAFREVRNAIVNYSKIKEICVLQANLEQSSKSYMELAQLQYINGVINYLDVLDAQRSYFDAQISLSNAIRDEWIAVVELYKALGGGW